MKVSDELKDIGEKLIALSVLFDSMSKADMDDYYFLLDNLKKRLDEF